MLFTTIWKLQTQGFHFQTLILLCAGFASIPLSFVLEESLGRTPARETVAVRLSARCAQHSLKTKLKMLLSNFFLCRDLAAATCKQELWPGALVVAETHLESMQQFLRWSFVC